jgi:23S rRNA (uracil1939-C5)-methyltransferase
LFTLKNIVLAKKKKQLPVLEAVLITDVAAEGKALARVNDMVVFVPFVAPGDIVDIQLNKKKHHYAEGYPVKFHSYSNERAEPFCEHFGVCGGCKWQHLPYHSQLRFKQKQVIDALERIGKIRLPELVDAKFDQENISEGFFNILGSIRTKFYRNKLEFTFSDKRWLSFKEMETEKTFCDRNALGFHIPGMFDKVLDIKHCWLQDEISNRIRLSVKDFCNDNNYPFFNLKSQEGLMRNLIIRTSSTGEVMVILVFFRKDDNSIKALLEHVSSNFPEITSLIYIINEKANDTIGDQEINVYKGSDFIIETMENLRFKVGPKSFYQTNSQQAYELYKVVRSFAALEGDELVYDLYTGTGTIAQFLAGSCRKVMGIEYVNEAIEDARINAGVNHIDNAEFFAGDMKDLLTNEFVEIHGRPDVLITDPPRAGMHENVVETILKAAPKRIVYVSCNPATQARDIALLSAGYVVTKVQPVDLFPHTQHVENVALLVSIS